MKKLFSDIYEAVKIGENIALVSVIADSGSTPRGAGAKMVVHMDGSSLGTIGEEQWSTNHPSLQLKQLNKKNPLYRASNWRKMM